MPKKYRQPRCEPLKDKEFSRILSASNLSYRDVQALEYERRYYKKTIKAYESLITLKEMPRRLR